MNSHTTKPEQIVSQTDQLATIKLSVVIPAYNEEDNILLLSKEVYQALDDMAGSFELIWVDDASSDQTAHNIRNLDYPNIRSVFHHINCGQSSAIASGFQVSRGEWVATLDGDGQNDPHDLIRMLNKAIELEVDCVTGVRNKRKDNWLRLVSSKVANGYRNLITGDKVSDSGCGIRVVKRSALREIPVFNGMHRFLPTLLRSQNFTVVEVPVNHRERATGESKYGVNNRLWRGIKDCFGIRWYLSRAVISERTCETD